MQQDGRDTFRHDLANTSISILCGRIFYLCTFDLSRIIMTLIDRANCFRRIKLNITSVKHRLISPKCAALFIMHFQRVIQIYYVPLIPRMVNEDTMRLDFLSILSSIFWRNASRYEGGCSLNRVIHWSVATLHPPRLLHSVSLPLYFYTRFLLLSRSA